jgi:hypothetical protein
LIGSWWRFLERASSAGNGKYGNDGNQSEKDKSWKSTLHCTE